MVTVCGTKTPDFASLNPGYESSYRRPAQIDHKSGNEVISAPNDDIFLMP
jgi:hypothetical protein